MTRYRIQMVETADTGPDTADEDDLRGLVNYRSHANCHFDRDTRLANAVAAALPKPRLVVRPGDVLRHRATGERALIGHPLHVTRDGPWRILYSDSTTGLCDPGTTFDPDVWTVIIPAEPAP